MWEVTIWVKLSWVSGNGHDRQQARCVGGREVMRTVVHAAILAVDLIGGPRGGT